jgi:hypothetical protein
VNVTTVAHVQSRELTPTLRARIDACRRAEETYVAGVESASIVEIPKLELAAAVLAAVEEQTERPSGDSVVERRRTACGW